MAKLKDNARIYDREFQLLDQLKQLNLKDPAFLESLPQEFIHLRNEYEKLLRQTVKIGRISDANQMRLLKAKELEIEKRQLEQIVKERTKEIQDKNRQLEEQAIVLQENSDRLKELSDLKSRFFANITHEFRTPLTLLIGPLEQMLTADRSQVETRRLTLMLRNAQRLLGLINQLLELSKFESKKMQLHACPGNIITFLQGIVASFDAIANRQELEIVFQPPEDEITLYFDRERLEGVFYNLIVNAVKFTPPGGRITLEVSKHPPQPELPQFPDGYVQMAVADTGAGIPDQQLQHIFDYFYQAQSPAFENTKYKGSGIGLTITREVIELHHGNIRVSSKQGAASGTCFTLQMPLGKDHLQDSEIDETPVDSFPQPLQTGVIETFLNETDDLETPVPSGADIDIVSKRKFKDIILIVEDNADIRAYMRDSLLPAYKVIETADGQSGIDKAREVVPDIIISDIVMPVADGYQLCRELKTDIRTCHIPIILLTARAQSEAELEGLECGADDFITKPFNTQLLKARIKNLIELRKQMQHNVNRQINSQPAKPTISTMDSEFLLELSKVIDDNIEDPDFNVEQMSRTLYMSSATLYRKIRALSGESPSEFIRSCRLNRAMDILKKGNTSVTEVAFDVGFSSRSYFARCFKEKFHQSPSTIASEENESLMA